MKIEVETDEKDTGNEHIEIVSSIKFVDCTRNDLEEMGRFFLHAAKTLPSPRIDDKQYQLSSICLSDFSNRFNNLDTFISVLLDINEV